MRYRLCQRCVMQLCNEVCAGKVFESAFGGAWVNVSASALFRRLPADRGLMPGNTVT
ncbi:hypothetical protein [Solibaculum mannosilyticum]|uniref:hypothetical protein n=1 Tax=Solibaculum mannosilyticum TaxID=2780922 RepID=UPI0036F35BC6